MLYKGVNTNCADKHHYRYDRNMQQEVRYGPACRSRKDKLLAIHRRMIAILGTVDTSA